jgi:hypothetical protein
MCCQPANPWIDIAYCISNLALDITTKISQKIYKQRQISRQLPVLRQHEKFPENIIESQSC